MKDLPSVSAFEIEKDLRNYQERFYGSGEIKPKKKVNVKAKINDIFSSSNHVYKSRCKITTEKDIIERTIIGKTDSHLLTLNGEKILISNIIDIEKL